MLRLGAPVSSQRNVERAVSNASEALPAPFGDAAEDSMRSVESAMVHLLETENIDVSRMYRLRTVHGRVWDFWDLIWRRPEWFAHFSRRPDLRWLRPSDTPNMPPKYVGRATTGIGMVMPDKAVAVELSDQILSAIRNWWEPPTLKQGILDILDTNLGISPSRRRPTSGLAVYPPV